MIESNLCRYAGGGVLPDVPGRSESSARGHRRSSANGPVIDQGNADARRRDRDRDYGVRPRGRRDVGRHRNVRRGRPGRAAGGRRRGDPARPGLLLPERPAPGGLDPARRGRPIRPAGGHPEPGQRAGAAARTPTTSPSWTSCAGRGRGSWPTSTATTDVVRSRTSRRTCGPIPRSTGSTATSSTRWPTGPTPSSITDRSGSGSARSIPCCGWWPIRAPIRGPNIWRRPTRS